MRGEHKVKLILKSVIITLSMLFFSLGAYAQSGTIGSGNSPAINGQGRPLGGINVAVCGHPATGGYPCNNLATVYTDSTFTTILTGNNPTTTDPQGNWGWFVTPGTWDVEFYGLGITSRTITVTSSCVVTNPGGVCTSILSGVNGNLLKATGPNTATDSGIAANNVPTLNSVPTLNGNNALTGNESHTGAETFTQLDGSQVSSPSGQSISVSITAAGINNVVHISPGTYTLAAALTPLAGQRLLCDDGAILTQGSAANLSSFVNFSTNTANGASIQNCTFDGNVANQTFLNGSTLINIGGASNVTIKGNTFKNAPNIGVNCGGTGTNPQILNNTFSGEFANSAISCFGPVVGTYIGGAVSNNKLTGSTTIGLQYANGMVIANNQINDYQAVQTVNTNGTGAVAYNSGANFSQTVPGMFIRINGVEYTISAVGSNTALTILCGSSFPACPTTHTGFASIIGAGDLINVQTSNNVLVTGNSLFNGMGYGIIFWVNSTDSGGADNDVASGNTVSHLGGNCLEAQTLSGSPTLNNAVFVGNAISDCGMGGAANPSGDQNGGAAQGAGTNNTLFAGNSFLDDGSNSMAYCLYFSSNTGTVAGPNVCSNPQTAKVFGANLAEMTTGRTRANQGTALTTGNWGLSGNWGSSPSITSTTGYDTGGTITITSGTGSPGANPAVTLTFADGLWASAPICLVSGESGQLWSVSPTTSVVQLTLIGTPATGTTFTASFFCQ